MSQQGDQRSGQEDAWWGELYDKNQPDTGSAAADDSLDERFTSVAAVVRATGAVPGAEPVGRAARATRDGGDRSAPPSGGLPSLSMGYGAPHTRGLPGPPELQPPADPVGPPPLPSPDRAQRITRDVPPPDTRGQVPPPRAPAPPPRLPEPADPSGPTEKPVKLPESLRPANVARPASAPRPVNVRRPSPRPMNTPRPTSPLRKPPGQSVPPPREALPPAESPLPGEPLEPLPVRDALPPPGPAQPDGTPTLDPEPGDMWEGPLPPRPPQSREPLWSPKSREKATSEAPPVTDAPQEAEESPRAADAEPADEPSAAPPERRAPLPTPRREQPRGTAPRDRQPRGATPPRKPLPSRPNEAPPGPASRRARDPQPPGDSRRSRDSLPSNGSRPSRDPLPPADPRSPLDALFPTSSRPPRAPAVPPVDPRQPDDPLPPGSRRSREPLSPARSPQPRDASQPPQTMQPWDALFSARPEPAEERAPRVPLVPRQTRKPARAAEFVGERPPTYDAEPTAWPAGDPRHLADVVPDTVLDGACYGAVTLRATSLRGDSARYRGEPRRDALLTTRFGDGDGALVFVAMASGTRAAGEAHRAARDICAWLGGAVGRSHARLADDIRGGRRGELRSGLHRLTDRSYGRLRARAAELGVRPEEYTAAVRCLLLTADPACRTRVFFGVGTGGLFRLREGGWQDLDPEPTEICPGLEPAVEQGTAPDERMTIDLGIPTPGVTPPVEPAEVPGEPFRFRASVARPGDGLLLCSTGMAEPLRGEPELGKELARRWSGGEPPGLAAFLGDAQLRVTGYADDRTACVLWEA
ncbi:protein phosphatase 2C domain-containing protein [Streptomyces sp. NPDC051162]|uniref:protein phosphatase 2C domain-containing protein n=1 Tax=Streptomyces sp. NPDC051162 TaxID=3154747 RepID=UPI00343AA23B